MQDKVQLTLNGQELRVTEFNQVAAEAARADDVVLAEILRMAPYDGTTVTRGIMPFGYRNGPYNIGMIFPVTGGFHVNSFRAVIGSRVTLATDAVLNYTDIRSAYYHAAASQTIEIPAGGGTARVHLVYATLYVDIQASAESRLVKDPTSSVVAATSIVPKLQTYVTIGMTSVTAGSIPTIPADPTGGYNIPLAYIRTAGGWTTGSSLALGDILDASTVVSPYRHQVAPANKLWLNTTAGLQAVSGAGTFANWSTFTESRPRTYMPAEINGTVTRFIPILVGVNSGATDITDGSIVDDSIDWRNRVFKCVGQVSGSGGFTNFAWNADGLPRVIPNATAPVPITITQLGNSLTTNAATTRLTAFSANNVNAATFMPNAGDVVELYVDGSTGTLKIHTAGAGSLQSFTVFVWLEASHPFSNK